MVIKSKIEAINRLRALMLQEFGVSGGLLEAKRLVDSIIARQDDDRVNRLVDMLTENGKDHFEDLLAQAYRKVDNGPTY